MCQICQLKRFQLSFRINDAIFFICVHCDVLGFSSRQTRKNGVVSIEVVPCHCNPFDSTTAVTSLKNIASGVPFSYLDIERFNFRPVDLCGEDSSIFMACWSRDWCSLFFFRSWGLSVRSKSSWLSKRGLYFRRNLNDSDPSARSGRESD